MGDHPLKNRWILDIVASVYVCYDRALFTTFTEVKGDMKVGNT